MGNQCAEVTLLERLQRVPEDAREWRSENNGHVNIPYGRLCHDAAAEIERLTTEVAELSRKYDLLASAVNDDGDHCDDDCDSIAHSDACNEAGTKLVIRQRERIKILSEQLTDKCDELKTLTAECSDYKGAAVDAESRLIDLTEELLRRGKANGAIGWPQIRQMVERASASGSQRCDCGGGHDTFDGHSVDCSESDEPADSKQQDKRCTRRLSMVGGWAACTLPYEHKGECCYEDPRNPKARGPFFQIEHSHEAVDAFWRAWKDVGEPHIHGVYESTWMGFRAAMLAGGRDQSAAADQRQTTIVRSGGSKRDV